MTMLRSVQTVLRKYADFSGSDKKEMTTLGSFVIEGTLIETEDAIATKESDALFSGFMKYFLQGLITIDPALNDDATGAKNTQATTAPGVAHTAPYALISTPGNTSTEQVQAGILYAHSCLHARTLRLVMQPLSQVVHGYPTMAVPYVAIHADYAPEGQTIHMLVRMGTATTQHPVSMRRDANSLVHTP